MRRTNRRGRRRTSQCQEAARANASIKRGFHVGGLVSDHNRSRHIQAVAVARAQQHTRIGFAIVGGHTIGADTKLRVARTIEDVGEWSTLRVETPAHPSREPQKIFLRVIASADASLIGHHDYGIPLASCRPRQIEYAINEYKILDPPHMSGVVVYDPVAVEKQGAVPAHGNNPASSCCARA